MMFNLDLLSGPLKRKPAPIFNFATPTTTASASSSDSSDTEMEEEEPKAPHAYEAASEAQDLPMLGNYFTFAKGTTDTNDEAINSSSGVVAEESQVAATSTSPTSSAFQSTALNATNEDNNQEKEEGKVNWWEEAFWTEEEDQKEGDKSSENKETNNQEEDDKSDSGSKAAVDFGGYATIGGGISGTEEDLEGDTQLSDAGLSDLSEVEEGVAFDFADFELFDDDVLERDGLALADLKAFKFCLENDEISDVPTLNMNHYLEQTGGAILYPYNKANTSSALSRLERSELENEDHYDRETKSQNLRAKEFLQAHKPSRKDGDNLEFNQDEAYIEGTCLDMCPRYERIKRVHVKDVDPFEIDENGTFGPRTAVKKYRRPAAGNDEDHPWSVRPPPVLLATVDYLIGKFALDEMSLPRAAAFLRDRTRAIRQDFSVQGTRCVITLECFERIARLHIVMFFCAMDFDTFELQPEMEQLKKTLKSLEDFYKDIHQKDGLENIRSEPEFQAYIVLVNLFDQGQPQRVSQLPPNVRDSALVQFALRLHGLAQCRLGPGGYSSMAPNSFHEYAEQITAWGSASHDGSPFLICCLAYAMIGGVHKQALRAMRYGYRLDSKVNTVSEACKLLNISEHEFISLATHYNMDVRMEADVPAYFYIPLLSNLTNEEKGKVHFDNKASPPKPQDMKAHLEGMRPLINESSYMSFFDMITGQQTYVHHISNFEQWKQTSMKRLAAMEVDNVPSLRNLNLPVDHSATRKRQREISEYIEVLNDQPVAKHQKFSSDFFKRMKAREDAEKAFAQQKYYSMPPPESINYKAPERVLRDAYVPSAFTATTSTPSLFAQNDITSQANTSSPFSRFNVQEEAPQEDVSPPENFAPQSIFTPQSSFPSQSAFAPQPAFTSQSAFAPQPAFTPQSAFTPQPALTPQTAFTPQETTTTQPTVAPQSIFTPQPQPTFTPEPPVVTQQPISFTTQSTTFPPTPVAKQPSIFDPPPDLNVIQPTPVQAQSSVAAQTFTPPALPKPVQFQPTSTFTPVFAPPSVQNEAPLATAEQDVKPQAIENGSALSNIPMQAERKSPEQSPFMVDSESESPVQDAVAVVAHESDDGDEETSPVEFFDDSSEEEEEERSPMLSSKEFAQQILAERRLKRIAAGKPVGGLEYRVKEWAPVPAPEQEPGLSYRGPQKVKLGIEAGLWRATRKKASCREQPRTGTVKIVSLSVDPNDRSEDWFRATFGTVWEAHTDSQPAVRSPQQNGKVKRDIGGIVFGCRAPNPNIGSFAKQLRKDMRSLQGQIDNIEDQLAPGTVLYVIAYRNFRVSEADQIQAVQKAVESLELSDFVTERRYVIVFDRKSLDSLHIDMTWVVDRATSSALTPVRRSPKASRTKSKQGSVSDAVSVARKRRANGVDRSDLVYDWGRPAGGILKPTQAKKPVIKADMSRFEKDKFKTQAAALDDLLKAMNNFFDAAEADSDS